MQLTKKIELKKSRKREKIIEAASELFSQKNFHEVMMEDVARLASIAKGTLYNYFNSKEDLYFSIMVIRMENLINSLRERIKKEITAVDSLHSFVIHNYMFMVKYSCFFLMFQRDKLTAENSICEEFRQKKSELKDLLKNIVVCGKEEKLFRNIDTEFVCDLVLGSIYGAVDRAIDNKSAAEALEDERQSLFDFILKGVSSERSDGRLKEVLPLRNRNIVIARSLEDSADSAELFRQKGAFVISFPTLEIVPSDSIAELDTLLNGKIDIIIFTSASSVRMFIKRIAETGQKVSYEKIKVIAIGKKSALVCEKNGIPVSFIPKEFSARGLISELSSNDVEGKVILIPSSAIGRDELPEALKKMGGIVRAPVVYNAVIPSEEALKRPMELLKGLSPEAYIFTSPSSFRNFLEIMKIAEPKDYFNGTAIAAIGPTTKVEIEASGLRVEIMPEEYTMDGLLRASISFFNEK
ncbi:MAG: uroporphyrinogen-III synthase [Bacillota bacterium]